MSASLTVPDRPHPPAGPRREPHGRWRTRSLLLFGLTSPLKELQIPILDIKALRGEDSEEKRNRHLESLAAAGVTDHVTADFLYDTCHIVMEDRPLILDRLIEQFIADEQVEEYRPE